MSCDAVRFLRGALLSAPHAHTMRQVLVCMACLANSGALLPALSFIMSYHVEPRLARDKPNLSAAVNLQFAQPLTWDSFFNLICGIAEAGRRQLDCDAVHGDIAAVCAELYEDVGVVTAARIASHVIRGTFPSLSVFLPFILSLSLSLSLSALFQFFLKLKTGDRVLIMFRLCG